MGQIELMIRFEDLNRDNGGSDDDLNDLIVSRDIGAATARQMIAASIASNIDLTSVDSAGLVSATITIPTSCKEGNMADLHPKTAAEYRSKLPDMMPKTGTYKLELGVETLLQAYEYASPRFNSIPTATAVWNRAREASSSKSRIKPHLSATLRKAVWPSHSKSKVSPSTVPEATSQFSEA